MTRWTGTPPNIELLVIRWLKQEVPTTWVIRDEVPDSWNPEGLVTVVVERTPGSGSVGEVDTDADIDLTVYAPDLLILGAAIQVVEMAMRQTPASLFDEVRYDGTFGRVPYANEKVRRAVGTYGITARVR
jgi:hypothetical protein